MIRLMIKIFLSLLGIFGCSSASSLSKSDSSAMNGNSLSSDDLISNYHQMLTDSLATARIKAASGLTWHQIERYLNHPDNFRSVRVDRRFLFTAKTPSAIQIGKGFERLKSQYDTIAAYWRSLGLNFTQPVSREEFSSGLKILVEYEKIDTANISGWLRQNLKLAEHLISKKAHQDVAKVMMVAVLVSEMSNPSPNQTQGLDLTEMTNNVFCGAAPRNLCINGNHAKVIVPKSLRPLIEAALAQPAIGDQLILTDSGFNMVCDMPVCVNGKLKSQTIVATDYKRPSGKPAWDSTRMDPCSGLPEGATCRNNLICGPDTIICNNGDGGKFEFEP